MTPFETSIDRKRRQGALRLLAGIAASALLCLVAPENVLSQPGGHVVAAVGTPAEKLPDVRPIWESVFPEEESWRIGHVRSEAGLYLIEYTRGDEKVESWSQLVTFQYFELARNRYHGFVYKWVSQLKENCPTFRYQFLELGVTRHVVRWRHDGCQGWPAQEVVHRGDYVDKGVLVLQYAYYRDKASPDFEAWIRRVSNATIRR